MCKKTTGQKNKLNRIQQQEESLSEDSSEDYDEQVNTVNHAGTSSKDELVEMRLNGEKVQVMIDSGASVNIMGSKIFKRLQKTTNLRLDTNKKPVVYAYNSVDKLPVMGTTKCTLEAFGLDRELVVLVVHGPGEILLGKKDAEAMRILHIGPIDKVRCAKVSNTSSVGTDKTVPNSTKMILQKYHSLFQGIGTMKDVKVNIELEEDATPVIQRNSRVPVHLRPALERELNIQMKAGIIEPAKGPTPWVSRIVVVPKTKPGEVRVTVDLRCLNKATKKEHQPIPNLDEQLVNMGSPRYFTYLDGNKMFHQLELNETSSRYMTFSTGLPNWPLMRYKRMVMGWCNASSRLQEEMRKVLAGIPGVLNVEDDVGVYGDTIEGHDASLEEVFKALQEHGVTLGRDKCRFAVSEMEFMGLLLTRKGLQTPEKKLSAIQALKAPENKSEVRSFMGLIQYLARFIPDLANRAEPIQRLTRNDVSWRWTQAENKAFVDIKEIISRKETLAYFDSQKKTELRVDAGPAGLGAILAQVDKNGVSRPVAYASRTLSGAETRYSQLEKEALAIKWGCEKFNFYLEGAPFDVITDHRPLLGLFKEGGNPPPRIERWILRIQHLNFNLQYEPGKTNEVDVLSRQPDLVPTVNRSEEADVLHVRSIIQAATEAMDLGQVKEAIGKDQELQGVRLSIRNGKWDKSSSYFSERLHLSEYTGVLLYKDRIVVPVALRKRCLNLAHEGHQGITRTTERLRQSVWWPGMTKEVENLCRQCPECQFVRNPLPPTPLNPTPLPDHPWHTVGIDFKGPLPTGHTLLVLMDYQSRYPEVKVMRSTTAKRTVEELQEIFARVGACTVLNSDNGSQFRDKEFKNFMKEKGIQHRRVCPLYPAANGLVERFNGGLSRLLEKVRGQENWYTELQDFLFAYRTTPHPCTGKTPAELFFGRPLKTKLPTLPRDPVTDPEIMDRDKKRKQSMKEYADNRRQAADCSLAPGDMVLLKKRNVFKKGPQWHRNPAMVTERKHNAVVVQKTDGRKLMRNCSELRPAVAGTKIAAKPDANGDEGQSQLEDIVEDIVEEVVEEAIIPAQEETEVTIRDRATGQGLRPRPKRTEFFGK